MGEGGACQDLWVPRNSSGVLTWEFSALIAAASTWENESDSVGNSSEGASVWAGQEGFVGSPPTDRPTDLLPILCNRPTPGFRQLVASHRQNLRVPKMSSTFGLSSTDAVQAMKIEKHLSPGVVNQGFRDRPPLLVTESALQHTEVHGRSSLPILAQTRGLIYLDITSHRVESHHRSAQETCHPVPT